MVAGLCHIPALLTAGVALAGLAQTLIATAASVAFKRAKIAASTTSAAAPYLPSVSILKPLHGQEPVLREALQSFFTLDYPRLQLIFGVQDAADPAIAVVESLCRAYPHVSATLVVNARPHGTNRKVANLINMFPSARHDVLVISDSDMHVAADYLRQVVHTLAQPGTGLVTSIYTGLPANAGLSAQLGSAYINQIFASGALTGALSRPPGLSRRHHGAHPRDAGRRSAAFPSCPPMSPMTAYWGAACTRALGLDIRLAPTVPATTVSEAGFTGPVPPRIALGPYHPRHGAGRLHPVRAAYTRCSGRWHRHRRSPAASLWRPVSLLIAACLVRAASSGRGIEMRAGCRPHLPAVLAPLA